MPHTKVLFDKLVLRNLTYWSLGFICRYYNELELSPNNYRLSGFQSWCYSYAG